MVKTKIINKLQNNDRSMTKHAPAGLTLGASPEDDGQQLWRDDPQEHHQRVDSGV